MEDFINIQEKIIKGMIKENNDKLEELFLKGLKRKGYTFDRGIILEDFIKSECRCEVRGYEKVYFVKDIPFLMLNNCPKFKTDFTDKETKMSIDWGTYTFL